MLDKVLHFSLTQRLLVILGAIALAIWGAVSWTRLNLDAVPDITTNQVQINTETGGMGPEEVERLVTFPIETAMGGLPGVEGVRSLSQYGLSQVTVTFGDHVDIFFARQLVNERLGNVREVLPSSVEAPQMGPVSTGLGDIYMFSIESDKREITELRAIMDWQIAPQVRTVPGVAEVNVADGNVKQYQVVADPMRLQARGLGVHDLIEALQNNNQNAGGGVVDSGGERVLIRSVGMATKAADIELIPITTEEGTPVLVRDVADVTTGTPVLTGLSTKDGQQAMVAIAMMLKGANGRTVSEAVDKRIGEIKAQLPEDVKLTTVYNRSILVNKTVSTVQKNLLEGGALVIFVLLVLLGNLRGALLAALVIPLSMLFGFSLMTTYGISGNLMSLGAIDFGLIVDGAVFMIENAVRRLAERREHEGRRLSREEVRQTTLEASREVAKPTLTALTIITVVYLPILALEGTEGKMFKPMAWTVAFCLIGALLLTLTLVPTLASLVLSGDTKEKNNPVMGFFSKLYRPTLDFVLRYRGPVVAGSLLVLAVAGLVFTRLGSEFIPTLDEGDLVVQPIRARTVNAEETVRLVTAAEKKVKEVPEVITMFSRSGTPEVATDPMPISLTDSFIMLKERGQWRPGITKDKIQEEIEGKLSEVPGQGYNFSQPIEMRFSELVSGVKADIGIKVFGEDLDVLKQKADEIAAVVRALPGARDVEVEQVEPIPVLQFDIDREAIARYGVSISEVQELVSSALGGEEIGQIIEGDKRFALVVRLPEELRNDPEAIASLPIKASNGESVPLFALAHIDNKPAPAQISRESGKRRVVVQLNVRGTDMGTFVAKAQAAIQKQVKLPEGYYLTWGGQFENLQKASQRLMIVVPAALGLIFLILFMNFGSMKQTLLIYTGVPLAITGGVFALALRGLPFSISAGVGFIALSGVAVLHGVVMVSAINRLREDFGLSVRDAVRQGAMEKLRPVLMTALVAALGFVPMALNTDIGAEVQRPLATVVIGGIASATLLTLVIVPVLYTWFERERPGPEAVAEATEGANV
ncbi:efflux RND transporter permease subunit [Fimbriimonadia bacterium ATM]|nr:MAG: efflux RND transporter permease subunit [Armatimonadota bacterium]MBC6969369.1 AcrB/AcrD/AcrF family protein [Armatimonadota bacterium]MCE7899293.1 efflux RND transporter permease subunit [Armatimonadetes bacterium ATM1]MDL1927866.1 efflux RND transporter permease subunit [Fimbriimonadia bacterium ATM]RIJ97350.1 MAG: CusA/CzcA family heavy metal efflux RND transporter [Armatimonadota bacterium]